MRERGSGEYAGIDLFRPVAALLVTAIHVSPLADVSAAGDFFLTSVLARLAVPFFFMTSGFFTVTRYAGDAGRLESFLKRTLAVYLAATLIYLPVSIRNGYFAGGGWVAGFVRDILLDGTAYHLWYLPASLYGAATAWYLVRRADYPWAFAVSGGLYLLGLFGDSWAGAAPAALRGLYGAIFELTDRTRIFMAPLFFVSGAYLRDSRRRLPAPVCAVAFSVSLAAMTAEAFEVRALGWANHYSMYLTLPVCAFFLFELLLSIRGERRRAARSFALAVYIIHPMAIIALRAAARPLGLWGLLVEDNLVHFLAVAVLSSVAALPAALYERGRARVTAATGRAWRELDREALAHNVEVLRGIMPEGCELMAVIKANAYGHGELELARELESLGVRAWAAASIDEAIALRRYGIHGEILILGYTDPARAREIRRFRLTQTIVSDEYAGRLERAGVRVRCHVKIDTGMHRLGVPWSDGEALAGVFRHHKLKITGMYTHLACSESREAEDRDFTREQARRFDLATGELEARGIAPPPRHIQSTYGLLNYPELSEGYVRAGLGIYGVLSAPGEVTALRPDLRPVLSVRARVALIRDVPEGEGVGYGGPFRRPGPRRIAILPIGYGDGYPRELSGGVGYVLLHGKKAPVAGAVCMDQLAVDVTDIPNIAPGDAATVIGRDGDGEITAPELAKLSGTITNELLSRLGPRLKIVVR